MEKKRYEAWTISAEFWEAIKGEIPKKRAGSSKGIQECSRSRAETNASEKSAGGDALCASDLLPVEGAAP